MSAQHDSKEGTRNFYSVTWFGQGVSCSQAGVATQSDASHSASLGMLFALHSLPREQNRGCKELYGHGCMQRWHGSRFGLCSLCVSDCLLFQNGQGPWRLGRSLWGVTAIASKPYALLPPSSGFHHCIGLANTCRNIQGPGSYDMTCSRFL